MDDKQPRYRDVEITILDDTITLTDGITAINILRLRASDFSVTVVNLMDIEERFYFKGVLTQEDPCDNQTIHLYPTSNWNLIRLIMHEISAIYKEGQENGFQRGVNKELIERALSIGQTLFSLVKEYHENEDSRS